jgi:urease subunit alpha
MVAAVHVLDPRAAAATRDPRRARARADDGRRGLLHDLGIIHMLSSDSQGMGRAGEVLRRALQNADWCKRVRGARSGHGTTTTACCATWPR